MGELLQGSKDTRYLEDNGHLRFKDNGHDPLNFYLRASAARKFAASVARTFAITL
jgi:hypothetical protein